MKKLICAALTAVIFLTGCAYDRGTSGDLLESSENKSSVSSDYSSSESSFNKSSSELHEADSPESGSINNDTSEPETFSAKEITDAMGLGWNLGNQLEASIGGVPSETAWGNPEISGELFAAIKQAGFSTVRIPVSYLSKIGASPNYEIDAQWLGRVRQVVDLALEQGLFVIINIHADGYYTVDGAWLKCAENDTAQAEITDKLAAVWKQIAERFKDCGERLIFESMNEIFDNTYGAPNPEYYKNLNEYNRVFVETVRKTGGNNARRWLLIPGWNTNIGYTVGDYGFVIPEDNYCEADKNRLMISVHFYDPYNFTLDENQWSATTQWGQNAVQNYDGWGQEDYVQEMFAKLSETFVRRGFPVVIGEFGAQDKSHLDGEFGKYRCYYAVYVVSKAKENGCIPIYWDNGWNGDFGFGIFDRSTLTVTQPELLNAMITAINS